jgi:hypothetical protein
LLLFLKKTVIKEINPRATRICKDKSSGTVGEGSTIGSGAFVFVGFGVAVGVWGGIGVGVTVPDLGKPLEGFV